MAVGAQPGRAAEGAVGGEAVALLEDGKAARELGVEPAAFLPGPNQVGAVDVAQLFGGQLIDPGRDRAQRVVRFQREHSFVSV